VSFGKSRFFAAMLAFYLHRITKKPVRFLSNILVF